MIFYHEMDESEVAETMYKIVAENRQSLNPLQFLTSLGEVNQRLLALTLIRCFEDRAFFEESFEAVAPLFIPDNFKFDNPSVRDVYGIALVEAVKAALATRKHWDKVKEICKRWEEHPGFGAEIVNDLNWVGITPDEAIFLLTTVPALVADKPALLGFLGKVANWYRAGTITTTVTETSGHTRVVIALLSALHSALTSAGNTKDGEVVFKAKQVYEDIKELIPSTLKSGKENDEVVLERLFNEVETLLAN